MPRYRRHELEDALAESLAERSDLPAGLPDPFPIALRRAQEGRLARARWRTRLRSVSGDTLILIALSLLYGALCCAAAWRLWP